MRVQQIIMSSQRMMTVHVFHFVKHVLMQEVSSVEMKLTGLFGLLTGVCQIIT